jgi:hypothetical protein
MIDKITPRPDGSIEKILEENGLADAQSIVTSRHTYVAPFVNAEECQYLVVEDHFPNGRPPMEKSDLYRPGNCQQNRAHEGLHLPEPATHRTRCVRLPAGL